MTILNILQYPDSRLHTKGYVVNDVASADIQKIIDDMLETLAVTPNCAALAATQLDILNPPAITVVNSLDKDNQEPLCLINPKIISKSGEDLNNEGCMSVFPNELLVKVKRAKKVTVHALDRTGKQLEINAEDFFARCLQHEIDHLNGVIYLDLLSPLKRNRVEKKIAKILKD